MKAILAAKSGAEKPDSGSENKTAVLGIVERGGRIQAAVVPNVKKQHGITYHCRDC